MAFEPARIDPTDWHGSALLQLTLDAIPDPIFVKDREHRWVAFNDAFCGLLQRSRPELLGRSDPDFFPPEQVEVFWRLDDAVTGGGAPLENEEQLTSATGEVHTIWTRKLPLRNSSGAIVGLCGVITDVTRLRRRMHEAEQLERRNQEQQAVIAAQTAMLDALAMPVVEVWDGVLLMSLIGELSPRRAELAMHGLLTAVTGTRARAVLIDLTGLPAVDAAVAGALTRTVRATALLGCQAILCGLGPQLARTFVDLDLDLDRVPICGSVRTGLTLAIKRQR
jgi:rsbT co-antagonist protein RsbR